MKQSRRLNDNLNERELSMKRFITKAATLLSLSSGLICADVTWYQMGAEKALDLKGVDAEKRVVWVYRDNEWYCNREGVAKKLTTIKSGEAYWCLGTNEDACRFDSPGNGYVDFKRGWNLVTPRYRIWELDRFSHLSSAWRYENGQWYHFGTHPNDPYPTTLDTIDKGEGAWLYLNRLDVTIAGMPLFCASQSCLPADVPSDNFYLKFKIEKKDYSDIKIGFMIQRLNSDNLYRFAIGPFNVTKEGILKNESVTLCAASPSSKICRSGSASRFLSSDGEYVTLNGPAMADLFKQDKPDIQEKLSGVNGAYKFRIYTENLPIEGKHAILNFGKIGPLQLGNEGIEIDVTFHKD